MRESEKRIREYQQLLPFLREKVSMTVMMFVISIVMMTAASFAWITISRSPEVEGIATTVSANGNLEIALADVDGLEPDESQVGDSGKDVMKKNITWGNLINLAHDGYSLDKITLQPAALDESSLLSNPLYSVTYGMDGRVTTVKTDFAYATYDESANRFMVRNDYGVRTIASVRYEAVGAAEEFLKVVNNVRSELRIISENYKNLGKTGGPITELQSVMSKFAQEKLDSGTPGNYYSDLPAIINLMTRLNDEVITPTGDIYLSIVNLQILLKNAGTYEVNAYKSVDALLAAKEADIRSKITPDGVSAAYKQTIDAFIKSLNTYKSDLSGTKTHLKGLEDLLATSDGNVLFSKIEPHINFFLNIRTTTIAGKTVNSLGMSDAGTLLSYTNSSKPAPVVVHDGAIKRIEERLGAKLSDVDGGTLIKITVKYGISVSVYGRITTDATTPYQLPTAISGVVSANTGNFQGGDAVAQDTYGMAMDFWIRSNDDMTFLTLEGNATTEIIHKQDEDGYYYYADGNGVEYLEKDGSYYDKADRENPLSAEALKELTLTPVNETRVIGYEGVNRVWDDGSLTVNSATQGSGSCFVFYADTPEDQQKTLTLLNAMKIAFVDEQGNLLTFADMDTSMYYAEGGRVTVPLTLRETTSISLGADLSGKESYAITQLTGGKAMRITAIIYVDGTMLSNDMVTATKDMEGQLNIQFGSSQELQTIDNEIKLDEIKVSATASQTNFENFDWTTGGNPTTTLTVSIDGNMTPNRVSASFVRQVNSTQGSREPEIVLTRQGTENTYTGVMTFTTPGNYVLRTVWLDGVEYRLQEAIKITIPGISVDSVTWELGGTYVRRLTSDTQLRTSVSAKLSYSDKFRPKKVQAIISNEYNNVITVNLSEKLGSYTGEALFETSGNYELKYLIIDGEYYEIPTAQQKTLNLTLGLRAEVGVSKNSFIFDYENAENNNVSVYVTILDDRGNKLSEEDLQDELWLFYRAASGQVEQGANSKITWSPADQKYFGEFAIKAPSTYSFAYVLIGESGSITTATAPNLYVQSPTPPSYLTASRDYEYVLATAEDEKITMTVNLKDAAGMDTDTIKAVVLKDGEEYEETLTPTIGNGDNDNQPYIFTLPVEDGTWTIKELHISGLYVDGVQYTESHPYVIAVEQDKATTTIETLKVKVLTSAQNAISLTGEFMKPHTIAGDKMKLQITNGNGDPLKKMPDTVTVVYRMESAAAGYAEGTDTASWLKERDSYTVTLKRVGNTGNEYQLADGASLKMTYAGTYVCEYFSFTIDGTTYLCRGSVGNESGLPKGTVFDTEDGMKFPSYNVSWTAPVLKVTGISPSGTFKTYDASEKEQSVTAKFDDYSATVYFKVSADGIWYIRYNVSEAPKITMNLSGYGNMTDATCTVINVNNGSKNLEYKFTSGTAGGSSASQEVLFDDIWGATDKRYPLGSTEVKTVTLTKDGVVYNFTLANPVTINNPY